jgi:hypothetical protein
MAAMTVMADITPGRYEVASISRLESVSLGTDLVEFRLRLALRSGAPPPGDSKERKDV